MQAGSLRSQARIGISSERRHLACKRMAGVLGNSDMLAAGLAALGIQATDITLARFSRYSQLLIEWNAKFNLTRIAPQDFESLHFLDSLQVAAAVDLHTPKKVVDLGSGAGFPGLPLAIVFPHLEVTLIESSQKKVKFLNEVVLQLDLKNVSVLNGRAETLAKETSQRNNYDLVVARAVASLETLIALVMPYLKSDGVAVLHKGAGVEQELIRVRERFPQLSSRPIEVKNYAVIGRADGRLVMISRTSHEKGDVV